MKLYPLALGLALFLCGCVGGPTKDYYNPAVVGARFKPPVTMARVEDVAAERDKLVKEGYTVIGTTQYMGKNPEAAELSAQAKRAGANHVIYSARYIPPQPGTWNFSIGRWGGSAGTAGGGNDVTIVFMGR